MKDLQLPKDNSRVSIVSAITHLIILARKGKTAAARTVSTDIFNNLQSHSGDFADKQRLLLDKISNQYGIYFNAPAASGASLLGKSNETRISERDRSDPLPGVSLVAACMNREENLYNVIDSWLATTADEIVVVDWSTTSEIWDVLSDINDERLKVIRIDGEESWVAAHALNVGLRFASHKAVYRVDCDISLTPDFLEVNALQSGDFTRGFWKVGVEHGGEGQEFIQGTFGAFKEDLRAANYYDERILTYGWEDSELYQRLAHDWGLAGKLINPVTLTHIEQSKEQRLANQKVSKNCFLEKYEPTEFEGSKNKFYTTLSGNWGAWSPTQDYSIQMVEPRYYKGRRLTSKLNRNAEFDRFSEVLAARQLALWAAASMPILGPTEDINFELSRLLLDAHRIDKSFNLVEGLKTGKNIYFIRCEERLLQVALIRTLKVMRSHYPNFDQCIFLVESSTASLNKVAEHDDWAVFTCGGELIDKLAARTKAVSINGIGELEALMEMIDRDTRYLALTIDSLVEESRRKASRFSEALGGNYLVRDRQFPGTCLVTSLYDEQNVVRLIEYLACVIGNISVFEHISIYYEQSNGILAALIHKTTEKLRLAPGRVVIVPFQNRPTFEELFSIQHNFPVGTVMAVANADIVFDGTFARVHEVDLSQNVVVLSRRDISDDGKNASLIRLDNDNPNTFSQDAWIVSTPFEPDFYLDYSIGTMHCDSFINHQIGTSSRYGVINPCFDIRVFHLHDERFNSSAEKYKRDIVKIKELYNIERERNGGVDPIKGVPWTTLSTAAIIPACLHATQWCPKVVVLNLSGPTKPSFGHLLVLHKMCTTPELLSDATLTIKLNAVDLSGSLGLLLARYKAHFNLANLLLDVAEDTDKTKEVEDTTVIRDTDFQTIAEWIAQGNAFYEHVYDILAWPAKKGIKLLRCAVMGDIDEDVTLAAFRNMLNEEAAGGKELEGFFNALPEYTNEKNLITPYLAPQTNPLPANPPALSGFEQPTVTFVTSLFMGGVFLEGYLENVYRGAREVGGEIIIIDVNKDDQDLAVIEKFLDQNPDARNYFNYMRLENDPGLYECWRIGIENAKAELITNANIDDRRCPQHTARLVRLLNQHPEYPGACGSMSCVTDEGTDGWFRMYENQVWFYNDRITEVRFDDLYLMDENGQVKSRDVMHCMPVWRKSLHDRHGYFDEDTYGTSADWAFWLKCSKAGEAFLFDKGAFGRYFLNPQSHNRRNDPEGLKELRIIKDFIGISQSVFWKN